MIRVDITALLTVEIDHVSGQFATKGELAELTTDALTEALEDLDGADLETSESAEYRISRTLYSFIIKGA